MADVEIRNILLTPYSTLLVFGDDNTYKFSDMYSVDQEILDTEISNSMEYTEYSFMNKVLVTSESVLKYLVLPKQNKMLEGPIKLDKVFAFTTDEVSKPTDGSKRYSVAVDGDGDKIIHKYLDCNSVERFKSDEDFISSRMQAIYDYAQGNPLGTRELKIEPVQIENEKDGIEQNLKNIFVMVDNIIEYIESNKENNVEVRVYVDMTGGFRTIPMYLLFILNILEKRGIIIEKVYYAQMSSTEDKKKKKIQIDDLTQILKTQDFTNGIHEFIKFGSAQELSVFLNKDLEKDANPEHRRVIKNFVKSVESFAEAITISNRTKFEESIKQIKNTWMDLDQIDVSASPNVPIEEKSLNSNKNSENSEKMNLLKIFEPRIYSEYKLVWDNPNHLSYIKWCLDHNFIQQALTLYIELIPEILFEKNEYGAILECIDEESLRKSYDGGVYKFEYTLLNQADLSVESRKHDLIESPKYDYFSNDVKICKEILKRIVKCKPKDKAWIENTHKTINENTVKDFFVDVQEYFDINKKIGQSNEAKFSVDHIKWKRATLDERIFNKIWKRLVSSLTDLDELANLYKESLNNILQVVKYNSDLKDLQGEKILEKVESICKREIEKVKTRKQDLLKKVESVHAKIERIKVESVDDISEKDKNDLEMIEKDIEKLESIESNRAITLLVYLFLKNKCTETLIKCLRDAYIKVTDDNIKVTNDNQNEQNSNYVKHQKIVEDAINKMIEYVDELKNNKKYALKKEIINMDNVSPELLDPVILPYAVKPYHVSGHSNFDKKIEELDKRFRVDDVQVMIDGKIDGREKKIKINENLRNALRSGKIQLQASSDALSIIRDSVEINKFKEIEERYYSLFPTCMGGTAPDLDMWNRDNLSLLILRILLYPYHTLKLIRNDSVHAREERQFNVSREDIKKLITSSVETIESYLEMCRTTEIKEDIE